MGPPFLQLQNLLPNRLIHCFAESHMNGMAGKVNKNGIIFAYS